MTSFYLTLPYHYPAHSYRVSNNIIPALPLLNPSAYAGHISEPKQAAQYGLDAPYAQIKASDNSGHEIQLQISSQAGTSRYLSLDDTGDVYLIDNDLLTFLSYARIDYLAIRADGEAHFMVKRHKIDTLKSLFIGIIQNHAKAAATTAIVTAAVTLLFHTKCFCFFFCFCIQAFDLCCCLAVASVLKTF